MNELIARLIANKSLYDRIFYILNRSPKLSKLIHYTKGDVNSEEDSNGKSLEFKAKNSRLANEPPITIILGYRAKIQSFSKLYNKINRRFSVFTMPFDTFSPDPKLMEDAYRRTDEEISSFISKEGSDRIIGVSLGTGIGTYLANKFESVRKLDAFSIGSSHASAKRSAIKIAPKELITGLLKNFDIYYEITMKYDQINNLDGLAERKVKVFACVGLSDWIVRNAYKEWYPIKKAMVDKLGDNFTFHEFFGGHIWAGSSVWRMPNEWYK